MHLVEEQDRALAVLAEPRLGPAMTSRTSFTVAVTAESCSNTTALSAITWASVVLPVPGGPQRITDELTVGVDQGPQRAPGRRGGGLLAHDVVEAARAQTLGQRRPAVELADRSGTEEVVRPTHGRAS